MAQRIIGITGKKRAGKNTLASLLQELHPYQQLAFAGALWDVLLATNPWVHEPDSNEFYRLTELNAAFGYERCKSDYPDVREYLQRLGTEGIRTHVGDTIWLDLVVKKIRSNPKTDFVVTDIRFDNEAAAIQKLGGTVVKLERYHYGEDQHESEARIDAIHHDVLFVNTGDLNDLRGFAHVLHY